MIKGTTPTLTFTLPFDVPQLKVLWITFAQFGQELFTLELDDCTIYGATITTTLSQEQTLLLSSGAMVEMQIRFLTLFGEALASDQITTPVKRILKEGVIK